MSGHSKWNNIRHRKGKSDAIRAKTFTKIGRELVVAVKNGGPDPEANSRLKDVIVKARAVNMPTDNIARAIKKASGAGDTENYDSITYEGYGPAGVAVIVDAMTDNRNRTAGDVRHYFDKYGGNLGTSGCVSFIFEEKGMIVLERSSTMDDDEVMMQVLEAGADDFNADDDLYEVLTAPAQFSAVRDALEKLGFTFVSAEITRIPTTMTRLETPEQVALMEKLIDFLEDLDDVQQVYTNWEQD